MARQVNYLRPNHSSRACGAEKGQLLLGCAGHSHDKALQSLKMG